MRKRPERPPAAPERGGGRRRAEEERGGGLTKKKDGSYEDWAVDELIVQGLEETQITGGGVSTGTGL